jgi:hypothetical protein
MSARENKLPDADEGTEQINDALARASLTVDSARVIGLLVDAIGRLAPTLLAQEPQELLDPGATAILTAGGLDLSTAGPNEADPLTDAAAAYVVLLNASTDVAGAAERLDVDGSRVRQLLRQRAMFGIREENGWRIPLVQFDGHDQVRGLRRVLPALRGGLHPLAIWRWLIFPSPEFALDGRFLSPIDWLRSGGSISLVRAVAEDL